MVECSQFDLSGLPALQEYLPEDYSYCVCEFEGDRSVNSVHLRVALTERNEVKNWLQELQNRSFVTWRVSKTFPRKEVGTNVFKARYRCQHNTLPRSKTADARKASKNTGCKATLVLTLKRSVLSRGRKSISTDHHLDAGFFLQCVIINDHNHCVHSAETVRHRDVSVETRAELTRLFEAGHSPSTAVDVLRHQLQQKHGDDNVLVAADRALCADLQYCYRLYHKLFRHKYGAASGDALLATLRTNVLRYNVQFGSECVRMSVVGDQPVVAVCTPLMRRVHQLWRFSSEMIFMESSGRVNKSKCRVFLLLTHSPAGALPLGLFVTTSDADPTIEVGLALLRQVLPDDALHGRLETGPSVIMTKLFERTLTDVAHNCLGQHSMSSRFHPASTLSHAEGVLKDDWLVGGGADKGRADGANNYSEAGMHLVKEKIMGRRKAYNIVQLLDFLTLRFPAFFERKLTDVANNHLGQHSITSRFYPDSRQIQSDDIVRCSETQFEVRSETDRTTMYSVSMDIGVCSCPVGHSGAPCVHQGAVAQHFIIAGHNILPCHSADLRLLFYTIATGKGDVPGNSFVSTRSEGSAQLPAVRDSPSQDALPSTRTPPASTAPSTQQDDQLIASVRSIAEVTVTKFIANRELLRAPLQQFVRNSSQIVTDSHLVSALNSYGVCSAGVPASRRAQGKANRPQAATQNGVQPTAKKPRRVAPPDLTYCTDVNVALGNTHHLQ